MYTTTQKENQTAENVTPAAVSPIRLQPKLSIGAVNDPMEYEADAMADKVMSMHELPSVAAGNAGGIQRKCSHCEEEEKVQRKPLASFIQRKESSAVTVASDSVSNQINATKGSGSSMDRHTQSFMQNRFGTDFNDVKIHTGGEAIQMNRELSAKAFTVGNDIYFNEGQYNPNSDEGKHLLAHELTHTVQQSDLVLKKVQKKCTSEAPDKDETIYTTGEGEAKKKYSYAEESSAEAFISKHPELNLICHKIKEAAGYVFTIYLKSKSPDPSPKDPEKKIT